LDQEKPGSVSFFAGFSFQKSLWDGGSGDGRAVMNWSARHRNIAHLTPPSISGFFFSFLLKNTIWSL